MHYDDDSINTEITKERFKDERCDDDRQTDRQTDAPVCSNRRRADRASVSGSRNKASTCGRMG